MNTHRFLQIHNLEDNTSSRARVCRKAAANLARIGNSAGSKYYSARAERFERIASKCRSLLSGRPECKAECPYRMKYDSLPLQRNALRVEIFTPADRCGWNLKSGRVGGRPDDYHPCTFAFNS